MWVLRVSVGSTLLTETSPQPQNLAFEGRGGTDLEGSPRAFISALQPVEARERGGGQGKGKKPGGGYATLRVVFMFIKHRRAFLFFILIKLEKEHLKTSERVREELTEL